MKFPHLTFLSAVCSALFTFGAMHFISPQLPDGTTLAFQKAEQKKGSLRKNANFKIAVSALRPPTSLFKLCKTQ